MGHSQRKPIGLRMDTDLWHELRVEAVRQQRTCGDLVETLIRDYLQERDRGAPRNKKKKDPKNA